MPPDSSVDGRTSKPGANGNAQPAVTATLAGEKSAAVPDHGCIAETPVCVPQVGGLAMIARDPPSKSSRNRLNGSCGLSLKYAVT